MTRPARLLVLCAACLALAAGERNATAAEQITFNYSSFKIRYYPIDPKDHASPVRSRTVKLRAAKPRVQRKRVRIQRRAR